MRRGARLVDVREAGHERASGMAEGARASTARHSNPIRETHLPDREAEILLICQSGQRSSSRQKHWPRRATAIWHPSPVAPAHGRPPACRWCAHIDDDFAERYSRHLRLPEVGLDGQKRLAAARVLLVGAGGLGSPAAFYLAAAGVGTLRLVDDDVVDRSNLQRQILHTDARIGAAKVESAAAALSALNPRTRIGADAPNASPAAMSNACSTGVDVVIDGADNFAARYLLNDACVKLGKPLVYGAVHRFEGQVSVFDAGRHRGDAPCYRCLFPEPPPPDSRAQLLRGRRARGVLPGVIGLLQATEAIKLLLGIGDPLSAGCCISMRWRCASGKRGWRPTRIAPCARRER